MRMMKDTESWDTDTRRASSMTRVTGCRTDHPRRHLVCLESSRSLASQVVSRGNALVNLEYMLMRY